MSPSVWQILIVLVIVLILFGPKRIPGLGQSIGEAIRGFKKGMNDDEIDVTDSSTRKEEISESNDQNQNAQTKKSERQES